MNNKLEIKDQVLAGKKYYLVYHGDFGTHTWGGSPFYSVAESAAPVVVNDEVEPGIIKSLFQAIVPESINEKIELQEYDEEVSDYGDLLTEVTPEDMKKAQRLFFAGAPAQVWLLMASGLVRPKEMGISVADVKIAVLTQRHESVKITN